VLKPTTIVDELRSEVKQTIAGALERAGQVVPITLQRAKGLFDRVRLHPELREPRSYSLSFELLHSPTVEVAGGTHTVLR
jgi:hypothetical protein